MDSADQRSDCTFCAVWSWSTLSTKASYIVFSKETVNHHNWFRNLPRGNALASLLFIELFASWQEIPHYIIFTPKYDNNFHSLTYLIKIVINSKGIRKAKLEKCAINIIITLQDNPYIAEFNKPFTRQPWSNSQHWQTTNSMWCKWCNFSLGKCRKHCGKRRKCWLPALFFLFPQCFPKASFPGLLKLGIVW